MPPCLQLLSVFFLHRSYAFGVVLWELITWEVPYTGVNTWQVRRRLLISVCAAPPPASVARGLMPTVYDHRHCCIGRAVEHCCTGPSPLITAL